MLMAGVDSVCESLALEGEFGADASGACETGLLYSE